MGYMSYEKSSLPGRRGRYQRYLANAVEYLEQVGDYCSVKELDDGSVQILSHSPPFLASDAPSNFLDILKEWGCTWLWRNMRMTNSVGSGVSIQATVGGEWIYKAINYG
jgi:hypothetical protein